MRETPSIALTQLALWYDPTRIHTWPSFLASLPEDVIAPSPTDLGRNFATERMTSKRHAAAFNLVRNLPGLELRGGNLQLRGVGLLERSAAGYMVSSRGKELGIAYAAQPNGTAWLRLLVDALLGREPRTRALVRLLSARGAILVFERSGWFDGSYKSARLERAGEPDLFPLDSSEGHPTLREPLTEDPWWCLGDWRTDPLLGGAACCRFRGLRGKRFSLHDVGLAIRSACEALALAGILRATAGAVHLDVTAAADLLPDRAVDFGWVPEAVGMPALVALLSAVLPSLRSATGHVVASELRDTLRAQGITDPDRAIAEAETEGRILIYAEDYGQARHGSGLFGDPRKQLVKLRIVGGGPHE